jgi:hypothetical protein
VTAVHPGKLPAGAVVVVVAAVVVVVAAVVVVVPGATVVVVPFPVTLKVNWSAGLTAEVPLGVVTVISTV